MKVTWLNNLLNNLKVGDLIIENYGSFKKSLPYVVTEISEEKIICRLLKNNHSEEIFKTNKSYCSKDKIFQIDKLSNFPIILKINDGYKDTDEERNLNIQKIW